MELRVLRYFLVVAREGNITRAAQLLHLTQPTLSRQLIQLEESLGVKLLHRGQHSVTLTDDGILLKRRAQELVALADKTEQEFSQGEALSGKISIGCGETCSMHELSQLMTEFRQRHPMVSFEIYSAIADEVKDRMERGILDFGLLTEPTDVSRYDFVRMPHREQWGVLLRKDTPLAQKEVLCPADFLGTPLLMIQRESVRNELINWFGSVYDQLEIAATYNLIYNAAIMVKNGFGTALCFRVESHFDGLCFRPLLPKLETGSVLIWSKYQIFSPAAEQFLEQIKKYRKSISNDTK